VLFPLLILLVNNEHPLSTCQYSRNLLMSSENQHPTTLFMALSILNRAMPASCAMPVWKTILTRKEIIVIMLPGDCCEAAIT
jgi:hypothetical protein